MNCDVVESRRKEVSWRLEFGCRCAWRLVTQLVPNLLDKQSKNVSTHYDRSTIRRKSHEDRVNVLQQESDISTPILQLTEPLLGSQSIHPTAQFVNAMSHTTPESA